MCYMYMYILIHQLLGRSRLPRITMNNYPQGRIGQLIFRTEPVTETHQDGPDLMLELQEGPVCWWSQSQSMMPVSLFDRLNMVKPCQTWLLWSRWSGEDVAVLGPEWKTEGQKRWGLSWTSLARGTNPLAEDSKKGLNMMIWYDIVRPNLTDGTVWEG